MARTERRLLYKKRGELKSERKGEGKCERKCEGKYEGKCEGKCEGQREGMRTSSGLLPSPTSPSRPRASRGPRIPWTDRSPHARACSFGE